MKLVVTGAGRSATGYTSTVLRACGVACGHEKVFHPKTLLAEWGELDADASWIAVPHMRGIKASGAHVLHQIRDPLAVVRSLYGLKIFEHHRPQEDPYLHVIWKFDKAIFAYDDPLRRVMSYWIRWNLAAEAQADGSYRIESMDPERLHAMCRLVNPSIALKTCEAAIRDSDRTYNTRGPDLSITWQDLPVDPLTEQFCDLAERYGYHPQ